MIPRPMATVTLWFGPRPIYFPLFAESCCWVQEVDFHLFVDRPWQVQQLPDNVFLHPFSRAELQERCEAKLEVSVPLHDAYKLCDLKPMLGLLLEDELREYRYWGSCDLDQIFTKDLDPFLKFALSENVDIVNTHLHYLHGPLLFFRNTPQINRLFEKSQHWRAVASDPGHYAFDECGKKHQALDLALSGTQRSFLDLSPEKLLALDPFECMTTVVLREYLNGAVTVAGQSLAKEKLEIGESIRYCNGTLQDSKGRSWAIYHWVSDKERRRFGYPDWPNPPRKYDITQLGFFDPRFPWRNFVIKLKRFATGALAVIRDRARHSVGKLLCRLGIGPDPGPFR